MQTVLLGVGRWIVRIPWAVVRFVLPREANRTRRVLGGLDEEHRRVHHFVVRELPRIGGPMTPAHVAAGLALPEARVIEILDELERRLIFLYRPGGRDVVWAYPLCAEPTPHHLTWSSGEKLWAA